MGSYPDRASIVANEYSDDMEEMFRSSVDGTLELIRQQRTLIGEHGLDLKVSYKALASRLEKTIDRSLDSGYSFLVDSREVDTLPGKLAT